MNISVVEGDGEMLRYSKHDLQMVVNDAIRFTGNLLRIAAEVAETALLKDIEAQQQEIDRLNMKIAELREQNQALKAYAENADADKDEQAGTIMRLANGLKKLRSSLQWLKETIHDLDYKAWAEDNIGKIDALLGGKEDA